MQLTVYATNHASLSLIVNFIYSKRKRSHDNVCKLYLYIKQVQLGLNWAALQLKHSSVYTDLKLLNPDESYN